jgi:hypothetical protein
MDNWFDDRDEDEQEPNPYEDRRPSIQELFEMFDREHPDVYEHFVAIAWNLKRSGVRHYGSKAIFEVIRYHRATTSAADGSKPEPFKINNIFTSRYARKMIAEYPEFADFFSTRELQRG